MPMPAGLSTVHCRTVGRAPARTSTPVADRVTIRTFRSSAAPSSTSSAGEVASCPSTCRSCRTAEARTVSGTPSAGAMRTEPGEEPSGPRRVTARSTTRFSR